MSEETLDQNNIPDILDTDLSNQDTSMPVLKAGLYEVVVKDVERIPNKEQTGENLKITLATLKEEQTSKGGVVPPGFPIFTYIALTETEKYSKDNILRNLAQFTESVHGEKIAVNPLDQHKGRACLVKLKIQQATEQYEESNSVRFIKPE